MADRNILVDTNGCEWMQISQYVRALEEDFDVVVTSTTVSLDIRQKRIPAMHVRKTRGRNTVNYTLTVKNFFELHPKFAPSDFENVMAEWQKTLPASAKKLLKSGTEKIKKDYGIGEGKDGEDQTEEELSAAEEKRLAEKIKRQRLEFEFDVMKGQYIHLDDLIPALQTIAIETRQAVESMIPRVTPLLAPMTDPHKIRELLTKECRIALQNSERVEELMDGSFQENEEQRQQEEMENES